jgi:MYXO-CTERM domain-containing protein
VTCRQRALRPLLVAGVVLHLLGVLDLDAPTALAYVRYQVVDSDGAGTGVYFYWNQSCVPMTAYPNDLSDMMTPDEINTASTAAAAAWSREMVASTFMEIQVSQSMAPTRPAGNDAYNVLVFRKQWCDPSQPALCEPGALAITSVFAHAQTGVITNADIEVNADPSSAFEWADLDVDPDFSKYDLQNALTHEMGHLIGLDHDCYTAGSDATRMTDNNGQPVPDCDDAPAAVLADTMFTSATPGDLIKRTLAPDDVQAVCDIYPLAADPNLCPPPPTPGAEGGDSGCACAVARPRSAPGAVAMLLVGLALALRSRRLS